MADDNTARPFLTDLTALRARARQDMDKGAVTPDYRGDTEQVCRVLNAALATELVCVLRYKRHAFMASGIHSGPVRQEFHEHAAEEQEHADRIAERIVQLGGEPDFSPDGLLSRSHSEYVAGTTLRQMMEEDLVAERIAIASYREMAEWFAPFDPTTRSLVEEILAVEEEHADDLAELLRDLPPGDSA